MGEDSGERESERGGGGGGGGGEKGGNIATFPCRSYLTVSTTSQCLCPSVSAVVTASQLIVSYLKCV